MPEEKKIPEEKKELIITKVEPAIIKKASSPLLDNQQNSCQMSNASHLPPGDKSLVIKKEKNGKDTIDDKSSLKNGKDRKKDKETKKGQSSLKWALFIFTATFILSISFSYISQMLSNIQIVVAFIVLVFFIFINIIFDVIAVSATACSVEPYLSMASRKIKGAKIAVKIVKNAEKVSNICGDVVGDICGIISGSLGALIVIKLLTEVKISFEPTLLSILFSSSIAALTVGGKALGKKFAFDNCQKIVFFISRILSVFSREKK